MNSRQVADAIKKRYSDTRQYAVIEEVGLQTGGSRRRIDMVVLNCYQSEGFRIDGFEIKVSVPDLRRELEDPDKHTAFFDKLDYFTLACPAEVANPMIDVIPKKWGILIINEDGTSRYKRKPLALKDEVWKNVSRGFFASVVRAIQYKQPSQQELKEAYERGKQEGKESGINEFDYMKKKVQSDYALIREYENIKYKLRLYGDNIDDVIREFEKFRNVRVDEFGRQVKDIKKKLDELVDAVCCVNGGKKNG